MEDIIDRKLLGSLQIVLRQEVTESIQILRTEVAEMKEEIIAHVATTAQQQMEVKSDLAALHVLVASYPISETHSSQNSGTTLSSGAELRGQPPPDDVSAGSTQVVVGSHHWHGGISTVGEPIASNSDSMWPQDDIEEVEDVVGGAGAGSSRWSADGGSGMPSPPQALEQLWLQSPSPLNDHRAQQSEHQVANLSSAIINATHRPIPAAVAFSAGRISPGFHRRHNPNSCMICRGSFKKRSSCKEHMLKCFNSNAACQFMPNCDNHLQLIRPFTGPSPEVRWISAVSEWIRRKE